MNLKLTKEIKAALFVLLGVFSFLIGFNFLNGTSLFKSEKNLYAIYDQVEGLQSGTTVTVNGLSVGKVSSIDFLPNSNRILVKFTVRNDLNFSKNSIAEIYEAGLIGGKSIAIIPVLDGERMLVSGDTLVSRTKPGLTDVVGSEIAPLQKKLEQILINADTLVKSLNTVLDDKAQQGINKALSDVSVTISNLNSITNSLSKILVSQESNINQTINNFSEASANINQISDSLSKTDLNALVSEIENTATTLNSILKSIESGEGTFGKLMKDEGLYNNLEASTKEVELLIRDLKEHPKRYVHFSLFGKKETPYNSDKKN